MDENILRLVKQCKLFASLSSKECRLLLSLFEQLHLKQNEILFHQGAPSDSLYILISGRLSAILESPNLTKRIVGAIESGETVGELGALSNEPRTLTIQADQDSILLKLSSKLFKEICLKHPQIIFESINPLINRSREVIHFLSAEQTHKSLLFIPAHSSLDISYFNDKLAELVSHTTELALICESDLNISHEISFINKIKNIEREKKVILYLADGIQSALSRHCLSKANKIYLIASGDNTPFIDPLIQQELNSGYYSLKVPLELILLQPNHLSHPKNTSGWLSQANFSMHHHVRKSNETDYQRLFRFIKGKAVGVVFSGGGGKGWTHIGVIKALLENNIPIDIIGGTSMGAIIGGLYTFSQNYEELCRLFAPILAQARKGVSFKNLTWPMISVFDCEDITSLLKDTFGKIKIENLWLSLFCVSCNLASYSETIHNSGFLWEKIRASIAIPGLIPPMVIDGELHIDGGILNNLPVDIMRQKVGADGTIFAVDICGDTIDTHKYSFPPSLPFLKTLKAKLGWGGEKYHFPPLLEMVMKSLLLGSSARTKINGLNADVLISPQLTEFSMFTFTPKHDEKLIQIGYQAAILKIQEAQATGKIFY